jgi:hypothetical protein
MRLWQAATASKENTPMPLPNLSSPAPLSVALLRGGTQVPARPATPALRSPDLRWSSAVAVRSHVARPQGPGPGESLTEYVQRKHPEAAAQLAKLAPTLPATPAEATRRAHALWECHRGRHGVGEVLSQPVDPCVGMHTELDAPAARQVALNASLERVALQRLSPAERAQYEALKASFGDQPQAQLALQLLLLDGRLTRQNQAGVTPLAALDTLQHAALAEGLERSALIGAALREIEDPTCIKQGSRGTCGATSIQQKLAEKDPAEYLRILTGLAAPEGRVSLDGGATLVRDAHTTGGYYHNHEGRVEVDNSGRTPSSRLIQGAFMEFANGSNAEYYDDNQGVDTRPKLDDVHYGKSGLSSEDEARLQEQLFGERFDVALCKTPAEKARALTDIAAEANAGHPVQVSIYSKKQADGTYTGGHAVTVSAVKDGYVYITNPWGSKERMTIAEFQARLTGAVLEHDMAYVPVHG